MIIRVFLLAMLAAIAYYAFLRRNKAPFHIVILLGMLGVAGFFVLSPETTNVIARAMGVGRGTDLVSYVVETALIFVVVHYYTKFVDLQADLTVLAREMALLRAELAEIRTPTPAGPAD